VLPRGIWLSKELLFLEIVAEHIFGRILEVGRNIGRPSPRRALLRGLSGGWLSKELLFLEIVAEHILGLILEVGRNIDR